MANKNKEAPWYVGGLHFECSGCGNCCAGPDEGYIWIAKPEIEKLANLLGMTTEKVREQFLTHVGTRSSIKEQPVTKDCVFLTKTCDGRGCSIYLVRPNQCRTWPFWSYNLGSPNDWNEAGTRCPGINRGKLYTLEQIENLKQRKKWWDDE
jgi:uncharacterized protein